MRELEYPFDAAGLLKNKKRLLRALKEDGSARLKKRIAVLGGSTTHDIIKMLELFLMNEGIEPEFYESEYNRYYEDVMFDAPELVSFKPELVYIHTSFRNIPEAFLPLPSDSLSDIEEKKRTVLSRFQEIWERLLSVYGCEVIQDNFERPYYRLLGNLDGTDPHGRTHFVLELNRAFSDYAASHESFHLNDADWLSADYGLSRWSDPSYWSLYKYCPAVPAIPYLAKSVASVIKAIYGRNKKAFALDLDNTLWGGVVGDDGPENIEIGMETAQAEAYTEFQKYLRAHKDIGVLLNIISKNEEENALSGLRRADSVLKPEDFISIRANWEPKDRNLQALAAELNLGTDAFVFVDDNPAERHIVSRMPGTAVPEMTEGQLPEPERYIRILDRSQFFEPVRISADDRNRGEMYRENLKRKEAMASFSDYGEYLRSLKMQAEIAPFAPMYLGRIAQLCNKSNQFNLTTRRYTQAEIERAASDPSFVTLYGRLSDCFGDNGVVSVVMGQISAPSEAKGQKLGSGKRLDLLLWLMSCRVLKRGMEDAMLDKLVEACRAQGIAEVYGYYYPTAKNAMVRDFYGTMGFALLSEDQEGNRCYRLFTEAHQKRNIYIA